MKNILFATAMVFVALTARATSITFTDNTFKLANYSETSVFKSDPTNNILRCAMSNLRQFRKGAQHPRKVSQLF
jgi:hypothetical protein